MNKIKFLSFILLVLFGMCCTKDAEIDLPEYKPTMVVHSYISPKDSGVTVYLNLSRSAYNNKFNSLDNIKNATVKISDGVLTKTLAFVPEPNPDEFSFYYIDSASFKIIAGNTYTLNISTPEGKVASASTKIPEIVSLNSMEYKSIKSQFGDSIYQMKFTFYDPAGQDDYYKFGAYVLDIDTTTGEFFPSWNEEYGNYFSRDGGLITEQMDVYKSGQILLPEQIRVIDFRLMHVSREYYLYQQSIQNFGSGPFAEPSIPFTNITGAQGVFAGYNYDQRIFR